MEILLSETIQTNLKNLKFKDDSTKCICYSERMLIFKKKGKIK